MSRVFLAPWSTWKVSFPYTQHRPTSPALLRLWAELSGIPLAGCNLLCLLQSHLWSLQDSIFAFWDVFAFFGIFFSVSETSLNLPKLENPWTCTQIYQCWYINAVRCSPAYLSSLCSAAQSSEAWSAVVWSKRIFKWWDWIFDNGGIMWMRRQESKRLILDASDTL